MSVWKLALSRMKRTVRHTQGWMHSSKPDSNSVCSNEWYLQTPTVRHARSLFFNEDAPNPKMPSEQLFARTCYHQMLTLSEVVIGVYTCFWKPCTSGEHACFLRKRQGVYLDRGAIPKGGRYKHMVSATCMESDHAFTNLTLTSGLRDWGGITRPLKCTWKSLSFSAGISTNSQALMNVLGNFQEPIGIDRDSWEFAGPVKTKRHPWG